MEETKTNFEEIPCFKEYTNTEEYKDLFANSKNDYPHISDANLKIAIYGWYSEQIQGIKLPEIEKQEPVSGEIINMDTYSVEEHKKMFPHLIEKEPMIKLINPLEKGSTQITNEILN